jgi:hypothetical protein
VQIEEFKRHDHETKQDEILETLKENGIIGIYHAGTISRRNKNSPHSSLTNSSEL